MLTASSLRAITQARRQARELVSKNRGAKSSPVDVENIAKRLGIDVVRGTFLDPHGRSISGLLKIQGRGQRPVIAINNDEHKYRQRFTIAHEIGHFILHSSDMLHIDEGDIEMLAFRNEESSKGTNLKEIQANQFAAELLMPSSEIVIEVQKHVAKGDGITDIINGLAEKYQVSGEAMMIKLGSIGLNV